jgi:ferredoxin
MKRIVVIDTSRCDFCGTCVGVCPADAIELKESVVSVIQDLCTLCGDCIVICPLGVPEIVG